MNLPRDFVGIVAAGALAMLSANSAAVPPAPRELDHQSHLERNVRWPEQDPSPQLVHSVKGINPASPYGVAITRLPRSWFTLLIQINNGKSVVFSLRGEWSTPFLIVKDRLYIADYASDGPGGSIVAVDLKTGDQIWRSNLRALGWRPTFSYANSIQLQLDHDDRGVIYIFGDEIGDRYIEAKLLDSGQTVGHVVLARGFDSVYAARRAAEEREHSRKDRLPGSAVPADSNKGAEGEDGQAKRGK